MKTISIILVSLSLTFYTHAANFNFIYTDQAGFGFNETAVTTPVGGNPGTTLGAQRRNLLEHAASVWAPYLQSNVTITITADADNFGGTPTSAPIAFAGPLNVHADFTEAPLADTWYISALADSLTGTDRDPGFPDLSVTINEDIDSSPTILGGDGFYYGFDHESGTQTDLLSTLLHEIGHGLGFLSTADESNGTLLGGTPDSFTRLMFDEETDKNWADMTNPERMASAINDPDLVFIGQASTQAALRQLKPDAGDLELAVTAPAAAVATYTAGTSAFGLGIPPWGINGVAVLTIDDTAPVHDACEAPFVNAADIQGKIAVIDRGQCNFTVKVGHAEDAGAIGVIIINNDGDQLVTMVGNNENVTIPSIFIGQSDGNALKAAMLTDVVEVAIINTNDLLGTRNNSVRLYAPNPVEVGSTASHWSVDTFPDLLMEPFITNTFLPQLDLSIIALRDIGWKIQNIDLPYLSYALWAEENIGTVNALATDNSDNDDWNNFAEYVFESNPIDSDDQPTAIRFVNSGNNVYDLFYTRNKLAGDIIFTLMQTTDLSIATTKSRNGIDYLLKASTNIDHEAEELKLELSSSADQSFFNIRAEFFTPEP